MTLKNALVPLAKAAIAMMAFGANIVLSRNLGVQDYGIFATSVAICLTIAGIIGNPIDVATLKVTPLLIQQQSGRAVAVLRSAFFLRALATVIVMLILGSGLFLYRDRFFAPADATESLAIASLVAVLGYVLLAHVLNYWQAYQRFGPYLVIDTIHVGGKVLLFLGLAAFGWLDIEIALWIYALAACAASLAVLAPGLRATARLGASARGEVSSLMDTLRWLAVAHTIGTVQVKIDLIMLGVLAPAEEAGLYMAAYNIGMIPELFGMFILVVFHPQIMILERSGQLYRVLKAYLAGGLLVCTVGCIAAFFLADYAVRLIYTNAFVGTETVFLLLLPASCIYLLVQPISSAYLDMKNPRLSTVLNAVLLTFNIVGNVVFIPSLGAIGAAATTLVVRSAVGVFIVWWTLRESAASASEALRSQAGVKNTTQTSDTASET